MDIFANNEHIISDVLNRIMNCKQSKMLYVYGKYETELNYLYPSIKIKKIDILEDIDNETVYIHIENTNDIAKIVPWLNKSRKNNDFILYCSKELLEICKILKELGTAYPLDKISKLRGYLFLLGTTFDIQKENITLSDFRVLAILHFYNEVDILAKTIEYLISQDIDLYLIDNWSNDGSYKIALKYLDKYPDRIFLERFPINGRNEYYEWYQQLERTESISRSMPYDWFIHYDVDEIRVSPWKYVTLREAIFHVDRLGYNCIENTVVDFKLTKPAEPNIFMQDTYFDFRHKKLWFDQVKTWKKSEQIELKSSGGHFAHVKNPKIYPLKILNRHYPLRSIEQARKKVFNDRLPRFCKEKAERGWHGHYDRFSNGESFLSDISQLLCWKENTFFELYISLFLECGLRWNKDNKELKLTFQTIENKRVLIYGAGNVGKTIYLNVAKKNTIVGWIDKNFEQMPSIFCEQILSPINIKDIVFDYLIVAILNEKFKEEVLLEIQQLGIIDEKIIVVKS